MYSSYKTSNRQLGTRWYTETIARPRVMCVQLLCYQCSYWRPGDTPCTAVACIVVHHNHIAPVLACFLSSTATIEKTFNLHLHR